MRARIVIIITSILMTIFFVGPSLISAHGTGASIEQTVDNYFLDIGYSEEILTENTSVRFDFNLYDASDKTQLIEFSDLWVRISQGNKTYFAGQLGRPQLGKTGMTIVLPEPGDYELYARYNNQDESLVEATFPLTIQADPIIAKQMQRRTIFMVFIAVILALVSLLIGVVLSSSIQVKSNHDKKSK